MTPLAVTPVIAKADVPITEIRWWNDAPDESWQPIRFTVPNQDTTTSVNGGELRHYDIHIAKLFELTDFLCQHATASQWHRQSFHRGISWSYEAANGNIAMGDFNVSCRLAHDIAIAYGLDKSESIEIKRTFNLDDSRPSLKTERYIVPTLNITGTKISKWLIFTRKLHPATAAISPDTPFPVQSVLSTLKAKTQVPIFLPEQSYFDEIKQNNLEINTNTNGYTIDIYAAPNCRGGACYFGTISAERNGQFFSPADSLPRDTFRHIELANGIEGIFFNGCGAYCTAFVEWKYEGVLYRIIGKNGEQPALVKMANSAIVAGSR